jgi:hypothetical protein
VLLEIASGSGEHAAFITPRLPPGWEWQPSETRTDALADINAHASDAGCSRIRPAIVLDACEPDWPVESADAILCCNMIHIAPWEAAEGLFAGSSRILSKATPLILYGPFKRNGVHTAHSNQTFNDGLRTRDPRWGVRCLETEVVPLADKCGFLLEDVVAMPANNLIAIFRRHSSDQAAKLA